MRLRSASDSTSLGDWGVTGSSCAWGCRGVLGPPSPAPSATAGGPADDDAAGSCCGAKSGSDLCREII